MTSKLKPIFFWQKIREFILLVRLWLGFFQQKEIIKKKSKNPKSLLNDTVIN